MFHCTQPQTSSHACSIKNTNNWCTQYVLFIPNLHFHSNMSISTIQRMEILWEGRPRSILNFPHVTAAPLIPSKEWSLRIDIPLHSS